MAKIDLAALKAASEGDQSKKVTVTKRWLRTVHDELARLGAIEAKGKRKPDFADTIFGKFGGF
jgi:hypothetical protein